MQSIKTTGIVLKGTSFGEADKILTVFTQRLGKVKVLAKGVRKIKSHLAGALEPFILSELLLHEGKTFYAISGAEIVASYPQIHSDLPKTSKAFFLGELIDNFVTETEKMPQIFNLFISALEALEGGARDLFLSGFELKIIEAAGFKPELYYCVHCKNKIVAGENFWDGLEGGVICLDCQQKLNHGQKISDQTIKLLRFLEQNNFAKLEKLKLDSETETETEKILKQYICGILEKELKSEKFLKYCQS